MIREKRPPGRPKKERPEEPLKEHLDGEARERAVRASEKFLTLLRNHHPDRDPARAI